MKDRTSEIKHSRIKKEKTEIENLPTHRGKNII